MMKKKPALLLLPNLLGDHRHHEIFLPSSVDKAVESIDGLIAESATEGRRYLGRFQTEKKAHDIPIALFNKHTPSEDVDFYLEPIYKKGERWGYVSDAGLPCLADPGALLVSRARKLGVTVQAFVGPSSMMLALMLSGLPGQRFAFYGYLPKDGQGLRGKIKELEECAKQQESVQIFIEAPHRNQQTLEALMETLKDKTHLCVAWDLTMPTQGIVSERVEVWKKSPLPQIQKKPAVFLIY